MLCHTIGFFYVLPVVVRSFKWDDASWDGVPPESARSIQVDGRQIIAESRTPAVSP